MVKSVEFVELLCNVVFLCVYTCPECVVENPSKIRVPIRVPNELFIKVSNSGGPGGVFVCGGVYASQLGGIFCVLCELYGKVCILPGLHGRYVW